MEELWIQHISTLPKHSIVFFMKDCSVNSNRTVSMVRSNHRQIVNVNGMKSDPATVLNGIPQSSVLEPILFVGTYLFADDTQIFWQITTKEDSLQLESDINSMQQWSQKWLLLFDSEKCHILTFGKFYNITHTEKYTLHRGKRSWSYPRFRAKIWWTHFGESEESKHNSWVDS